MKKKQFIAIEKQLLPSFPGFTIKESTMLLTPQGEILRGIDFDPSGFDKKEFYVHVFVLPLYVPAKDLYFNYGKRIKRPDGRERWDSDEPDLVPWLTASLQRQAIPYLSSTKSVVEFIELAKSLPSGNPHTSLAIAFSLARANRVAEAIEALNQFPSQLDLNVGWQVELGKQAKTLRSKLVESPAEAQRQLAAWEIETVRNLGLETFQ
jgi:hypothetical protein